MCVCVCVNSMKNKMTYALMTNINVKNNSIKPLEQDNKTTKKTRQENFIDLINAVSYTHLTLPTRRTV